jgi:uncharacterized membrane protein
MRVNFILSTLAMGAAAVFAPATALADTYRFVDLGTMIPAAINDLGQVVGSEYDINNNTEKMVYTGAEGLGRTYLAAPADMQSIYGIGPFSTPVFITNSGQIGGLYDYQGGSAAFYTGAQGQGMQTIKASDLGWQPTNSWDSGFVSAAGITANGQVLVSGSAGANLVSQQGGHISAIPIQGAGWSALDGYAVNASGQVAGRGSPLSPTPWGPADQAIVTGPNGNGAHDLHPLGSFSAAYAISNDGRVVGETRVNGLGYYEQSGRWGLIYVDPQRAFYDAGKGLGMVDLGTLAGDTAALAVGVNSLGQVVGRSGMGLAGKAFLTGLDGQGMTDLNSLVTLPEGARLTIAKAINEAGMVLASDENLGKSYLLIPTVPVPEAQTSALMGIGLAAVAIASRRRSKKTPQGC